jgi:bacteriochlorophyll 4-vinyl reductase
MAEVELVANAIVRQALMAAQEVMGANGLHSVLRASGLGRFVEAFPPDNLDLEVKSEEYAGLCAAIEAFYGRAARGMLRRIGKASFQYGLREQPALMGLAGAALSLLPTRQRILFVLRRMADALVKTSPGAQLWVDDRGPQLAFLAKTCSQCYGRHSDHPICNIYIGSIGEAVHWATGHEHTVTETHCIARGDAFCRFEVGEAID